MTIAQRVALLMVRLYQLGLAPFAGGACRFAPSCSSYAAETIESHGAVRGLWLAMRRLSRCHPFSTPGFDPVPQCQTGHAVGPHSERAKRVWGTQSPN